MNTRNTTAVPGVGHHPTEITADPDVPGIRVERVFDATPEQLLRAHTDPELVVRWLGPRDLTMTIDRWDARTGGEYRYVHSRDDEEYGFHGCFHEVGESRIVQTFTFEGYPDGVSLETITFTTLTAPNTNIGVRVSPAPRSAADPATLIAPRIRPKASSRR